MWFLDFAQSEWVSHVDKEVWFCNPAERIRIKKELRLKEWQYLKLKEEVIEFVGGNDPNEPFRFLPEKIRIEDDEMESDYGPTYKPSPLSVSETLERWLTKDTMIILAVSAGWYLEKALAPPQTVPARKPIEAVSFRTRPGEQVDQPSPFPLRKEIKIVPTIDFGTPTVSFDLSTATWAIESDPENLFFIRFGLTLIQEGTSQLATCPECKRIFYRVRKQVYCSKTCINRVSRRNWLKNPRNRKKDRQWAQKRYERRVKEKTNGNVEVQSRSKGGKTE